MNNSTSKPKWIAPKTLHVSPHTGHTGLEYVEVSNFPPEHEEHETNSFIVAVGKNATASSAQQFICNVLRAGGADVTQH
jgi:hypothetical protein